MGTILREQIRAGDAEAFGRLFDDHARSVYNHAYRLTGHWAEAEEAVSLTFLEAWRLRERVEPEGGSLRPWLLGIATNTVRNRWRAARRHAAAMERLPRDPGAVPDFAEELVGRIDDRLRLDVVRQVLAKLRTAEREVFVLCVWSALSYEETAEALAIPIGTVRSRLSRARRKLEAEVQRLLVPPPEPPEPRGQKRGSRRPAARPEPEGNR
ncbi:RNA polymerase sigma factor [Streptomyces sp. NPDC051940]|uniref:RNA polymerase sigma factor n=1 Tax=Streptomyces sp. NPDC051940 TaxID=3155675 RepID=UPI0034341CF6